MTISDFTTMVCDAVKRDDVCFIIGLADQYKAPEFAGIRDILNRLTLSMISTDQADKQGAQS